MVAFLLGITLTVAHESLKLESIRVNTDPKLDSDITIIEPFGYQSPATNVYSDRPISLETTMHAGGKIKFTFNIANSRAPERLRLRTTYVLQGRMTIEHPFGLSMDITDQVLNYRNDLFCDTLRLNQKVLDRKHRWKRLLIHVVLQGNSDVEITPIGPLIDEKMADNAFQTFCIVIPICERAQVMLGGY